MWLVIKSALLMFAFFAGFSLAVSTPFVLGIFYGWEAFAAAILSEFFILHKVSNWP